MTPAGTEVPPAPAPTNVPTAPASAPPPDLLVSLQASARLLAGGRVVAGGSPFRLLQVTPEGARALAAWAHGAPVGAGPARARLARRLLDADILTPRPLTAASTGDLTVVVPVRDRPAELERCLDALAAACPASPVVVVDDGSRDGGAVRAICAARRARVVRRDDARGPGAARNAGLAACATPYVAFVDSDVVLPAGTAGPLLGHFADPRLAAVAPRIRGLGHGRGLVGGYEERHSALDMGPAGGLVGPGRPVPFIPSAVLLVRRSAFGAGFDPSLRIGEDVDFVWRLAAAGWQVRYVPETEAWHEHRVELRAFVARRLLYGRSIGLLARRHPRALAAMWASPVLTAPWILLAAGRPRAGLAACAFAVFKVARELRRFPGSPYALASRLVGRGLLATGIALAQAVRRPWSPPLLVAAVRSRRARRVLLAAYATAVARDAVATRAPRPALADIPVRLLEEAIAAAGTWDGCVRERTARPLLPSRRPPSAAARP